MEGLLFAVLLTGYLVFEFWIVTRSNSNSGSQFSSRATKIERSSADIFLYFGFAASAVLLLFIYTASPLSGGLFLIVAVINFDISVAAWKNS